MKRMEPGKRILRWSVLVLSLAALGAGQAILEKKAKAQGAVAVGYVLGPNDGEALTRGPTTIRVKADPTRGSQGMAVGTQLLPKGAGIPMHQHTGSDEVLYILDGAGFGLLGETRAPIEKGSAIFIPRGAWHGVQNPDVDMLTLWIVVPPGLEAMFRDASAATNAQAKPLTRDQFLEIARKYGTIFK